MVDTAFNVEPTRVEQLRLPVIDDTALNVETVNVDRVPV